MRPLPLTLSAIVALALPASGQTQDCPQGEISYVFIDNHSIFDVDDLATDQPFRWAYRIANHLHVRTRESFLRRELLFRPGDCYDPLLLEETARLLRSYGFLSQVDVFALQQPDGSRHVVVDTQDEWTTKLDVRVDFDQGFRLRGVELVEENLLGRGVLVGAFFVQHQEQRDLGGRLEVPRLFGTRLDGRVSAGRTRVGSFVEQSFFYPFVGEIGRWAGSQSLVRREAFFPYAFSGPGEVSHVLLPVEEERAEVTMAGRIGRPGNLTIFGLSVFHEVLDFPGFPGSLEAAHVENFGDPVEAGPDMASEVRHQTLHSTATRVNLLAGQRNVRFVERRGLDALTGVQDVMVGTDVGLTLGRSVEAFSTGENQPDDLYTRLRLFAGTAPGPVVAGLNVGVEGRNVFAGGAVGAGWHDVLAELDALLYWQPRRLPGHTLLFRVAGAGGWNVNVPFQLTLGGGGGVRGFDEDAYPGGRRLIASVEERIFVRWPFPDLFDLGFTVFGDFGRMWPGDVPFGEDSGWQGTVGVGLRVGFPAGTRGVVRLDAALPTSGFSLGNVIFRMSFSDILGLQGGVEDPQLARSRRITVGPDLFNRTPVR